MCWFFIYLFIYLLFIVSFIYLLFHLYYFLLVNVIDESGCGDDDEDCGSTSGENEIPTGNGDGKEFFLQSYIF